MRSSHMFAGGLSPVDSSVCSLNQQVSLELGDSIQHLHRHPPRSACQIHSAEREAMDSNPHLKPVAPP